MKKCPFCGEMIQDAAIFCRFCRRDLPKEAAITPVVGGTPPGPVSASTVPPDSEVDIEAIMLLIHDLHSGDIHVRFAAQHALGRIGKPAIFPLLAFLDNKDNSNFVYEATFALAEMGETGIEPLMVALSANSPEVRSSAAMALGSIGEPAIAWLLPLIKHKEGWLRYLAFDAMGESCSARAVEPLIAALNDSDSFVRIRAARGLGKLKDQRAINPLRTRLHNESIPVIRDTIEEALGKLTG